MMTPVGSVAVSRLADHRCEYCRSLTGARIQPNPHTSDSVQLCSPDCEITTRAMVFSWAGQTVKQKFIWTRQLPMAILPGFSSSRQTSVESLFRTCEGRKKIASGRRSEDLPSRAPRPDWPYSAIDIWLKLGHTEFGRLEGSKPAAARHGAHPPFFVHRLPLVKFWLWRTYFPVSPARPRARGKATHAASRLSGT